MHVLLFLNICLKCNFYGLFAKESAWLSLLENMPSGLSLHAPSVDGT